MKFSLKSLLISIILICITIYAYPRKFPKIKIKTDKELPMQIGDTITLQWTTENVKHLYCHEISDNELPLNGEIKISPKESTIFLFVAEKGRKVKRRQFKLNVTYPVFDKINIPPIITDEETASINWNLEYADYVKIKGFDDLFPISGKIPFRSDKDTIITITAYNKFGYAKEYNKEVEVKYIEALNYPQKIARYGNANISWEYKNSDSIKFTNLNAVLPPQGDIYVNIEENTDFRIEVYRKDGTFEVKKFTINAYDSKIKYFGGNKTYFKGEAITLSWIVEDADSVKLSCTDEPQPLKGMFKYHPTGDEIILLNTYLNGAVDERAFKTHQITRQYIKGETDYSKIQKNVRLDYEIFSTDLSEFPDIVKLYVLVVDTAGNFVHGLAPPTISQKESQKHFLGLVETYVGGKSSKITDFKVEEYVSTESEKRNISMVLDYSGSMLEPINTLEFAAKSFINNKFDDDKINIIKFDDHIETVSTLTADKAILNYRYNPKGLQSFGGGTALYAAIGEGLYTLHKPYHQKELVVFTDGYENSSLFVDSAKAFSALQIAEYAKKNNIKISCISFGENVNQPLLEALASYTGGKYFDIITEKEIVGVWTELPYLSANYYVITFRTKSIDNINGVKLLYDNNIGQKITTDRNIYTVLPDELDETNSIPNAYWLNYDSLYNNKTPISLPQAIGYFSFNGTILIEDYVANVDILVDQMTQDTSLDVVIFGHTDQVDSEEYNIELSTKRCNWAKDFFIKEGISEDRIITIPLGEKYPVYKDEDEDWKALENRRIEVLLLK